MGGVWRRGIRRRISGACAGEFCFQNLPIYGKIEYSGGMHMTNDIIKENVLKLITRYPIKKIVLFGSRAVGTNRDDSDVDLIIEFLSPVSVLTLSQIKCELEENIGLSVDIIHGPIREGDMIEVGKVVELYAA
jgi:hypothetical protein